MTSVPFRFDIPRYDQAMADFMGEVAQGFLQQDGIIRQMPVRKTVHSGPSRNVRSPQILDQPLQEFRHTLTIPFDVIRNTDIDAFIQVLYQFADAHRQDIVRSMIQGLMEVTDASGNTTDAHGRTLCFDMINDALEMIEISFDERGEPILPTIMVGPEMGKKLMAIEPTSEELLRYNNILERKKANYNAQKRTRRLSR